MMDTIMKMRFITMGEPKGAYNSIFAEFAKRVQRFAQIEIKHIKERADTQQNDVAVLKATEGYLTILFDEHGQEKTSEELAHFIKQKEVHGHGKLAFVIGGTDGHSPAVRDAGDYALALSQLTLPHDLAMVVAIEALYRALTISAGHPYHRT